MAESKNTRPCWLCGQRNTTEQAQCGHEYQCHRCGIGLDHIVPLVRPLTGPYWVWGRPDDIVVLDVSNAARTWFQEEGG
jgi:hypothetical protein